MAHEDILGNAEVGEEPGVLVHDSHARSLRVERRGEGHRLPVDHYAAARGRVDPCQQLDTGALARAVLAEERQHLAGSQPEADVPEGGGAAECFRRIKKADDLAGLVRTD